MYKIKSAEKFLWDGIDLEGKKVLEGGTSWGNTTDLIAKKVRENQWSTELISIDIDDSHFEEIEERLQNDFKSLSLRRGDLSNLDFIDDQSIDVIICNYTLSSVDQFPMRALSALKEFYRVLKPGGDLLITEEMPIWSVDSTSYPYWSKRLRIIKSISVLRGMSYFNEIHPKDLEVSLITTGFKDIIWNEFTEKINAERATKFLDKRKQTLIKGSDDLENKKVNDGLTELTEELVKEFSGTEEFSAPGYVLRGRK
ncbi:class I SAM-dependent methyltransferase [Isachenkonia alkalipeptolytica]|uniref:Class I SAM-dependent methyltransferase n=1 Tax=Isachenkonia alkalipeptolytica TaxID=2565777 RepID=A0AA44BEP3_9CLOT|nr:class I SAM-dependent methyltransferase [Isachenkonia alkalipeptolytica]NBG89157.1 class I SAM-dependent methyltransferase [Isachenkonia alkalipeptolytica]